MQTNPTPILPFTTLLTLTLALLLTPLPTPIHAALLSPIQPFLKQHCHKCHGPNKQKAKLRLDNLPLPTPTNKTKDTWIKIAEAIEFGDMPPKKQPRPNPTHTKQALKAITTAITRSTTTRPIALRRLNRIEYQNTVRDLLGIDTHLAELLPEDASVQGFDNVATGLAISPVLMERYLEAADTAFDAVIRRIKPLPPRTQRVNMMTNKENIDSVKKKKGGTISKHGAFIKFRPGWPPVRLDEAHPREDGIFRCRIAVWPYQPGKRTLAVAVYVGPLFGPGKRRFVGMFDVTGTPEKPRIIEFTTRMTNGHSLHIVPWIYPEYTHRSTGPKPGIAVQWAETHGPLDQAWPSKTQQQLFGPIAAMEKGERIWMRYRKNVYLHNVTSDKPKQDAERIIKQFIPRAFRRPVSSESIQPYINLVNNRLEAGRTFEQAVRAGITAVLCSPHFLLLNKNPKVDQYTIASRLSYFLWSTMPDDQLLKLAKQNKLSDPKVIRQQVERMIKDPRISRFVKNFTGQWLDLRDIEFTTPDRRLFPEFDKLLQESMLAETRGFFNHILRNNLSVLNFIDSDFTVLNERLANHYHIPGIKGHEKFRVTKIPTKSIRGGILTHASVLKVTANGTNTSPVLRGIWVLDKLLNQPPAPPPPGVPAVEPDIRGAVTIRQQLAKHRDTESCARCHNRIDPPGFALESFDPIGGYRRFYRTTAWGKNIKRERGKPYGYSLPVQPSGQTPEGQDFANFRAYRNILIKKQDTIAKAIAAKLLIYATGRPITITDKPTIRQIVKSAHKDNLGLRSIIHAITQSKAFTQP